MPADGADPQDDVGESSSSVAGMALRLATRQRDVIALPPFSVSQAEEDAFAALIGDWDPMHNDPSWRLSGGDGPIVLGYHSLARLETFVRTALLADESPDTGITTVRLRSVRFPSPLPIGTPVHGELTVRDVAARGRRLVLTAAHRCLVDGQSKPTMVAEQTVEIATTSDAPSGDHVSHGADRRPVTVAAIPAGTPVQVHERHDRLFFDQLMERAGDWLGSTPWTTISDREAHAFALLCGDYGHGEMSSRAHPFVERPIPPLHLLSLRAYFSPYVGLPVLTDASMMAYNYGVDEATWHGSVLPGVSIRDHVQLFDVEYREPDDYLVTTRHVLEAQGTPDAVLVADCKTLYRLITDLEHTRS